MPNRVFEVYHPKMGFLMIESEGPMDAVERAADLYDSKYDMQIARGHNQVFGVRIKGSTAKFKWFLMTGRCIPVYTPNMITEPNLDPLYVTHFVEDMKKTVSA